MLPRRYLQTANFINLNVSRKFAWGDWDCNLFLVDLLDVLMPGEQPRSGLIRGKYSSQLGAARFQKGFTPAPEFIRQQGLELMQVKSQDFRELDIIFRPESKFWHMSLYFSRRTWAVIENQGLMINVVEPGEYLIARNNG